MEIIKETILRKNKRPKSASKYPKIANTFVTAFSLQEPFEIAPIYKISTKDSHGDTLTKSDSILPNNVGNCFQSFSIATENKSRTLNNSKKEIDVQNNQCCLSESKSPKIDNCLVVENKVVDEKPIILFNACNKMKARKNRTIHSKKVKRIRHIVKFKNVNLKSKGSKYNMITRLEKYYGKGKINTPNYNQIQKLYCSDISNIITRRRILKKVSAKENLLDDQITFTSIHEYDNWSLNSSYNKVLINCASQNTLVPQSFSTSMSGDFYDMSTTNSVVEISDTVLNEISRNENSIGIFNPKFKELNIDQTMRMPIKQPSADEISMCNAKIIPKDYDRCTKKATPISKTYKQIISSRAVTDFKTNPTMRAFSYDDIVTAHRETNNKTSVSSEFVSTSVSATLICSNCRTGNHRNKNILNNKQIDRQHTANRDHLFETVINLDTMTTNSSENIFSDDERPMKKAFEKYSIQFNSTKDLNEMWDRLTHILDSALIKFQRSLITEIEELKKILELFVSRKHQDDKHTETHIEGILLQNDEEGLENVIQLVPNSPRTKADLCLHVHDYSTKDEVVDRFSPKVNIDKRSLLPSSSVSLNELIPQVTKTNIEVLKLPTFKDVEIGKGDALPTTLPQLIEVNSGCQRVKQIISEPLSFVRENRLAVISYRAMQEANIKNSKGPFSNKQNTLQNSPMKQPKYSKLSFYIVPKKIGNKRYTYDNIYYLEKNTSIFINFLDFFSISAPQSKPSALNIRLNSQQNSNSNNSCKLYMYHKIDKKFNKLRKLLLRSSKSDKVYNSKFYYLLKVKRITYILIILKDLKAKYDYVNYYKSSKANYENVTAKVTLTTKPLIKKYYNNCLVKTVIKSRISGKKLNKKLLYHQICFIIIFNLHESNNRNINTGILLPTSYNIAIKSSPSLHKLFPYNFCTIIIDEFKTTCITNEIIKLSFNRMAYIFKSTSVVFTASMSVNKQAIESSVDKQRKNLETLTISRTLPVGEPGSLIDTEPAVTAASGSNHCNQNYLSSNTKSNCAKKSCSKIDPSFFYNNKNNGSCDNIDDDILPETVITLDSKDSMDEEMLNNAYKIKSNEVINNSTSSNKMWYQLTQVLDSAVKRVQKAFVTAIIELKKLLTNYVQPNNKIDTANTENIDIQEDSTLQEIVPNITSNPNIVLDTQGNLIKTKVGDSLKLTLNEVELLPTASIQLKELKGRPFVTEYVTLSKRRSFLNVEIGKGDTRAPIVPLTATRDPERFQRFKNPFCILLFFIRENLIAAAVSIPCFIIAYICLIEMITFARSIDTGIKRWNMRNEIY